jgi:PAS domain S-box-containing protein
MEKTQPKISLKILIAGDTPREIIDIERLLISSGIHFSIHHSSKETGEAMTDPSEFDLILLDVTQPRLEILKRLKLPKVITPVVVLTGMEEQKASLDSVNEEIPYYGLKDKHNQEKLLQAIMYGIERKKMWEIQEKDTFQLPTLYESVQKELSERKIAQRETEKLNKTLRALSRSSHAMMHTKEESLYLEEICKIVVEECGYSMVWIGFTEENGNKKINPVAHAGFDQGYIDTMNITWDDSSRGSGPTGSAIKTGKPCLLKNMLTDPHFEQWREEATRRGYRSSISLPLMAENKAFGVLSIYAKIADAFSDDEIQLLTELSNDLAYGITAIRLRDAQYKSELALKESEEKFRRLTENSNALICEIDANGKFIYINSKYKENLGYDPDDLLGYPASNLCHPDMEAAFCTILEHATTTNEAQKNEWLLKDKHNIWRWFDCYSNTIFDSKGIPSVSMVSFDITDKKTTEEQLKKLVFDLKHLNATKDKFFRIIAHDLKNPFSILLGASEVLLNSAEEYDINSVKEFSSILYHAAKSGYTLLENLLEWSKSQTGSLTFKPQVINAKELVAENISSMQLYTTTKSLKLDSQIEGDIEVFADRDMLNTILRNLLNNAIKFSHKDGIITIRSERSTSETTITVKDTGIGINPDDIDKLFRIDVKYTNRGTAQERGTGLGLILCKEFVEKHGGKIWVESEFGKGCEFKFTIPLASQRSDTFQDIPTHEARLAKGF